MLNKWLDSSVIFTECLLYTSLCIKFWVYNSEDKQNSCSGGSYTLAFKEYRGKVANLHNRSFSITTILVSYEFTK